MSQRGNRLDETLASLLERRLSRNQLRSLTTVPDGMVDFSSNAYLSLSSQPAVRRAFLKRLQTAASTASTSWGSLSALLGSGGSRLLDGNSSHAESLECTIATFHRAPAGLLFNSAMDANVGLFSCVPQPGDAIVYDELIHASVHDGMRLSRASQKISFAHSRVWETGLEVETTETELSSTNILVRRSLEAILQSLLQGPDGALYQSGKRNVFVAIEGVYSMDGDLAPLADIVACVERCLPQGNGHIIVDEAHSMGIFGDRGRGLSCDFGLEDRVWARVLGFGKAMGCTGGMYPKPSRCKEFIAWRRKTAALTDIHPQKASSSALPQPAPTLSTTLAP